MNKKAINGTFVIFPIVCLVVIIILIPKGKAGQQKVLAQDIPRNEKKTPVKILPRLTIGLEVNGGTEEIISGFPIFFTVTLRNLSAEEASQLRHLLDFHSNKASLEERQTSASSIQRWEEELESLPSSPLELRHEEKPVSEWISFEIWEEGRFISLDWPLNPAQNVEAKKLDIGKERIHLEYIVSEEKTLDIQTGDYKIKARLSPGLSASLEDEISSREVEFQIISAADASDKSLMQNHYIAGYYYLSTADYLKAEGHAKEILARDNQSIKAMTLLGRAKEGQGDLEEAEKIYNNALDIFATRNPDEQPPIFLIKKTRQFLEEKIKKPET